MIFFIASTLKHFLGLTSGESEAGSGGSHSFRQTGTSRLVSKFDPNKAGIPAGNTYSGYPESNLPALLLGRGPRYVSKAFASSFTTASTRSGEQ